jgi:hypothetical protein
LVDNTNYGVDSIRHVYFVHEVRWSLTGAGYRLARAVFYEGPVGTTVNVGPFAGTLIGGLEALSFSGFVGGCPGTPAYANPKVCADFAFHYNSHDEPVLCVWNPIVGAEGSAEAYCSSGPFAQVSRQRLPAASFTGSATFEFCPSPPVEGVPPGPCHYSVSVDASASTDPDGSIVEYRWQCGGQTMVQSVPTAQLQCTSFGPSLEVILDVVDNEGGVDETRVILAP